MKSLKNKAIGLGITALLIITASCSSGIRLLNKIPVHSIKVKVTDVNGSPIAGAQVMASNGRKATTNQKGMAEIRFGAVGIYNISVLADNRMPSNFVVTMPTDDGKEFTRQLSLVPTYSRLRFGTAGMYRYIYNYMFTGFGYSLRLKPYEETEWTAWKMIPQDGEAIIMKRPFLKENKDGEQWWRIMIIPEENGEPSYVAEMLFSKNRAKILRIREKIGDNKAREKPVTENWYSKPIELTDESIQGAVTKNNVSVKAPAGTFSADLLVYGPTPATSLHIWKTAQVPGGVIKYKTASNSETMIKSVLIDYGRGAETMLNSY